MAKQLIQDLCPFRVSISELLLRSHTLRVVSWEQETKRLSFRHRMVIIGPSWPVSLTTGLDSVKFQILITESLLPTQASLSLSVKQIDSGTAGSRLRDLKCFELATSNIEMEQS